MSFRADRDLRVPSAGTQSEPIKFVSDYSEDIDATSALTHSVQVSSSMTGHRLKARLTRSAAYAVASMPIALLWVVILGAGFGTIFALLIVGIGLLMLAPAMRLVGVAGNVERWVLREILDEEIERPVRLPRESGARGFFLSPLRDSSYWREFAFISMRTVLAPASFVVLVGTIVLGVVGLTSIIWGWFADLWAEEILISVLIGVVATTAGPALLLLLTSMQASLAHSLLSPDKHTLTVRANTALRNRDLSVAAAEAERQRIERDLHDGAQARLATVALDLGRAKRRLEKHGSDEELGAIIDSAHNDAKLAIVELRNLARGIHPAVLTDRGLDAALSDVAARCTSPVHLDVHLLNRPAPHIESAAYFAVCELLTNITKHSRATQAWVTVRGDSANLRIDVSDNGVGGAEHALGSGLLGLHERITGIDGTITIRSPLGAGTGALIEIPLVQTSNGTL